MQLNKFNLLAISIIIFISSCAYYNTFFNAKQSYELAQKKRKSTRTNKVSSESRTNYEKTIKKCWKLIDFYSDSSKYADDALLLIGKSHYQLEEYAKSARIFEQFIPKYYDSKLIPEAKLWLARTYVKLDKDILALDLLQNFFEDNKTSKNIASQVFYVLGELYIKSGEKEKAVENLNKCIKITDDDELAGGAQLLIAKNFMELGEFENAIANFKKTRKHYIPVMQHFHSLMFEIDALDSLGQFDKSEILLKKMLSDERFKDQYSIIETKLINTYEFQNAQISFIIDSYRDIIFRYKKTEGAALASFNLAQVFEFDLGVFDSAEYYYGNVKKIFPKTEFVKEAARRKKLLTEYLKIHNQLVQDRQDLTRIAAGDSLTVVSVDSAKKSENSSLAMAEESSDLNTNMETSGVFENKADADNSKRKRPTINKNQVKKKSVKKVVKLRKLEEINISNNKNSYALGEFFLLKYENYDSAEVAFTNYSNKFSDSLLIPKALYSLYYLYTNIYHDSIKSDSIKNVIIADYPNSIYGKNILGIKSDEKAPDLLQIELKKKFNEAEYLLDEQKYDEAIITFLNITEKDSASIWGEKALYATAYTYEKYVQNIDSAVFYYTMLMQEYPGTESAKIAMAKTKEPEPEKNTSIDSLNTSLVIDSTVTVSSDSIKAANFKLPADSISSAGKNIPDSINTKTPLEKDLKNMNVNKIDAEKKGIDKTK